ncbi:hypothetical protein FRB99_000833 [Tulasnella sp. 403]|nr:hypothetical protein FRB99_000833 [Tulasnella sp. 403]
MQGRVPIFNSGMGEEEQTVQPIGKELTHTRSNSNNTLAECCTYKEGDDNQLWKLDRRSRNTAEIRAVIEDNPFLSNIFEPYDADAKLLIIPGQIREQIYRDANLVVCPRRPHAFGFDRFVIKWKEAVMSWACESITFSDGYGILFGIVYGKTPGGPYAYNWSLSQDLLSAVFFDAQTGDELTSAALERAGFETSFATY